MRRIHTPLMLHIVAFADAVAGQIPAPVALRIFDRPAAPALIAPAPVCHHARHDPASADKLAVVGELGHGASHKAI